MLHSLTNLSLFILMGLVAYGYADELNLSQQQQKVFEAAKQFAKTLHPSQAMPHASRDTNFAPRAQNPENRILVFVSFSMGETAIQQYAREARKVGASLVFRGLIGDSLKITALRLQKLAQETQASFLIDPTAFRRFGIQKVPAVAVISDAQSFDVLYGLTTLDYALKRLRGQLG